MRFDLIAYGDAKPVSRRAAKGPGQLKATLIQHYGTPEQSLLLEVNPTTGHWELVIIQDHDRTCLLDGEFGPQGILVY